MPLVRRIAAALAVAAVAAPAAATAAPASSEVIVAFDGTPAIAGRRVPGRPDLRVVDATPAQIARLRADQRVRWVEPNATYTIAAAPNDTYYAHQWDLHPRAAAPGGANWEPVWGGGITGAGVTVAVLDTGITPNPQLANVLPGWNFVAGNSDTRDDHGHGTHVAGTIAQRTGDGAGTAGVAPGAALLPVKVLDDQGRGSAARMIAGLSYAVSHGAKVVNLSIGGAVDGGLCDAVAAAVAAGVTVVAATGNDGGAVSFPAACPGAVAVGATTLTGGLAPYSNRGPAVALTAPGGDMTADANHDGTPDGILQYSVFGGQGGYYLESGTSMAAPHVAGAAALVLQARPSAGPAEVRSILTGTAVDAGSAGPDPEYGAGRLDVAAAVYVALAGGAPPPPAVPANVERLAGEDRFATAAAVAGAGWPAPGIDRVYLASGRVFPDALAAGALAGRLDAPLLLTEPFALSPAAAAELARLRPRTVVVVGGPGAVSEAAAAAASVAAGAGVQRVAGADRYETAAALSRSGWASASTVYVASGAGFADALGGAALAAHDHAPLLLSASCAVPPAFDAELRRLHPARVVILGGDAAVCPAVADAVGSATGAAVVRLAGADRYATASAAAAAVFPAGAPAVFLASGTSFPDGLAAAPLAAAAGAPLLVVPGCDVPGTVVDAIRRLAPARFVAVGGTTAVCDASLVRIAAAASG